MPAEAVSRSRTALGTAALGVGLILLAGLLDAAPLYVPGVAFVLLAVLAALWVLGGARGVRVRRAVGARRVMEEDPVAVTVRITSPRPLPTGALLDPLLPAPALLATGRRRTLTHITVRFARRGRKTIPPPSVAVRDPFGLLTRVVRGQGEPDEILVLPRVEPVRAPGGGGEGTAVGTRRGRPSVAAEVEIDGLRPHRQGTPASRIFWPSLARGEELQERRLRADSDTRPVLVLDPRGAASTQDLDAAVRATASLAVHLAQRGGCALLIPGDRRPAALGETLVGWPHLHARLALIDGSRAPALAGVSARRGPVIYVAARRLTRPPRALAHAPGGGRLLVVPGTIPGRRPAFLVAGCQGYELSDERVRLGEAVA